MLGKRLRIVREHSVAAALTLIGIVAAAVYALVAPPVYESVGMAAIDRPRVEIPTSSNEDTKNRWIWVRDGLALQQALLSDDFLLSVAATVPGLRPRFEEYKQCVGHRPYDEEDLRLAFAQTLRRHITVDYTGGDANGFVVKVRDRNAAAAKAIAAAAIDHLRELALATVGHAYRDALEALGNRPEANAVRAASLVQQAYAKTAFQVLRVPYTAAYPIWPCRGLILAAGAFFGLVAGLALELLRAGKRR